jgi:hypothetical protein
MAQDVLINDTLTDGSLASPPSVGHRARNDFDQDLDDDLKDVFFGEGEFCRSVTIYHSVARVWKPYRGMFERDLVEADGGRARGNYPVEKLILTRVVLFADLLKTDVVRVDGINYYVDAIDDDGVGVMGLMLRCKRD